MPHPDPDDLALYAIGENVATAAQQHITGCPDCLDEVAHLRRTAERLTQDLASSPAHPPSRVWDAISSELRLGAAVPDPEPTPEPVTEPARPWWRRAALPVAAAIVGLAVGVGATFALTRESDAPTPTIRATAELGPVAGGGGLGRAELLGGPGTEELQIEASLPSINGNYEVWLLGADGRMFSLGVLHNGTGTFAVPGGVDMAEYKVVDISDEPADGDPTHSGDSVARGTLS
ncbi:ABC transporter substrate-binding protein [Nakamurella sp. YIM 132087]|uniref:ABC transporter substrate-binding protein n=1 Tax=Nakamurella alba TaxID=2665158 RepID=A0A7K1FM63_9ACTN|nr:anti-sigma factor [Nakamurella alba]MTD15196.1 ABC transporter substrate-binding protein [Nakamurella alba]